MLIKHRALIFSMFFLFALYVAWAVSIPQFESPDEQSHVRYTAYIATNLSLPNSYMNRTSEFHHPPLYYAISAPVYRIFGDSKDFVSALKENITKKVGKGGKKQYVYAEDHEGTFQHSSGSYKAARLPVISLRIFNLIFPVLTLLTVFFAAKMLNKRSQVLPYALVFFIALIPQFSFIESSFNNDNLAVLICTLTIFMVMLGLNDEKRDIALGVLLALGYLTKSSTYYLLYFVPLAILLFGAGDLKNKIMRILKIISLFAVLILPYSVYLFAVYGDFTSRKAAEMALLSLNRPPFSWAIINNTIAHFFDSFFAWFGWLAVRLPNGFYNLFTLFSLFAIIGSFLRVRKLDTFEKILGLAFICELIFFIALHVHYGINVTGDQGRHLYMAIFPIGYFLLVGFGTFADSLLAKFGKALDWNRYYISMIFVMIALNIYSLTVMIDGLW